MPAGKTVRGTLGCSLSRAETVPSPPTATRQRQRGSPADRLTSAARSSGVQAICVAEPHSPQRSDQPINETQPSAHARVAIRDDANPLRGCGISLARYCAGPVDALSVERIRSVGTAR